MSRFYLADGTVIDNLREARKTNALVSVTSVLDSFVPYGLITWKATQLAMAALTLPRKSDETEDAWWSRVQNDAKEQSHKAAEWGTRFADAVRDWNLQTEPRTVMIAEDDPILPAFTAYRKWFTDAVQEVLYAEKVLIGDEYAGRCDLCYRDKSGEVVMVDFKTQGTKGKKKVNFYSKYPLQLAAYAEACPIRVDRLQSIVFSSDEPGRWEAKVWEDTTDDYFRVFSALLTFWSYENNYKPEATNVKV